MRKSGLLHSEIVREISALGHTQSIVIADAGLPIPPGVKLIDLALTRGLPCFADVLKAVLAEGVFEHYIYAGEIEEFNQPLHAQMYAMMGSRPFDVVMHEDFKRLTQRANVVIRTGECTPYANVILIGGVNF